MTADILYSEQLTEKSDEEIKDLLRQSFIAVEKAYLNTIDNLIAQKETLQNEIPSNLSQYEISQQYQEILNQLNLLNIELSIGSSVVLALMVNKKIYIANIGSCRALLCKTDSNNVLRVIQVTVDFNLYNEEEILRFNQLGLDANALRSAIPNTRSLGNYFYKNEIFSNSKTEPITSDPEIVGSITLDDSCRFFLLLSAGLCQTLTDLYSPDLNIANKEIVQIILEQFATQSTLMGVAQSSISRISQLHHDSYMKQMQEKNLKSAPFHERQQISLLIRNFNYPMPNALNKRERHGHESISTVTATNLSYSTGTESNFNSNTNTSSFSGRFPDDCKIKPYVDFTDYYKNVEMARQKNELPKNILFD